jgi:hypothetical protein
MWSYDETDVISSNVMSRKKQLVPIEDMLKTCCSYLLVENAHGVRVGEPVHRPKPPVHEGEELYYLYIYVKSCNFLSQRLEISVGIAYIYNIIYMACVLSSPTKSETLLRYLSSSYAPPFCFCTDRPAERRYNGVALIGTPPPQILHTAVHVT